MQQKIKALLLSASVAALTVGVIALAGTHKNELTTIFAGTNSISLDSEALKRIALEDIHLNPEKAVNDKKFRISLGEDKYIDGAIVFQDCNLQYTGSTLGDFFGIDNTGSESANAYNFQILFSLENTSSFSFSINEKASIGNSSIYTLFQIKYGVFGGEDFYNNIRLNYDNVIKPASISEDCYDSIKFSTNYVTMDSTDKNLNDYYDSSNFNVVGLQVKYGDKDDHDATDYYVQPGQWIKFALTNLTIGYSCINNN